MKIRYLMTFLIALGLLGVTMSFESQPVLAQDCDYYASPNGNGSGLSESSPFQMSDFLSMAESNVRGKTLCLLDGTYHESLVIYKSGTASQPITIRAFNDGEAIVDGQNTRQPAHIAGDYIVVEGIRFQNSNIDVVNITGAYNVLRRCSAYNANPDANVHAFTVQGSYNLLEDCATGGTGRINFLNYDAHHNTLRRCYAKWESHDAGSPRVGFSVYGSQYILLENCITSDVFPNFSTYLEYYGIYQTWASYNKYETNHNRYYGCIAFDNLQGGMRINPSTGPDTEIVNSVFFDHDQDDPFGGHSAGSCGYGIISNDHDHLIVRNSTFVNNQLTGLDVVGDYERIVNSVFVDNGEALSGNGSHAYCDFWNNDSIGSSLNSSDLQVDPQFGQNYLYVPNSSPLKGSGEDGEDIGANVIYRYEDAILTDEPLWPWPMEERICDELGVSVTWKSSDQISASTGQRCTGGFWEDLDEIYGPVDQTCSSQGGSICNQDQTCPGEWIHASDSERCCSQTCIAFLTGDLNLDGKVDVTDVKLCVKAYLGIETDAGIVDRADVNGNEAIDILDIQWIVNNTLGS